MMGELRYLITKRIKKYPHLWGSLKYLKNKSTHFYKSFSRNKWKLNDKEFNRILDEFGKVDDFFFIQIGAGNGVMLDPLYNRIQKYRWKGILVEPQKEAFKNLKKNHKGTRVIFENVAISDKKGAGMLYKIKSGKVNEEWQKGLATFFPNKTIIKSMGKENIATEAVNCITMDELINRYKVAKIDILQIDVEGYDYEVIKLINFKKIKPKIIHYEHQWLKIKERRNCKKYLKKNGYKILEKEFDTVAVLDL